MSIREIRRQKNMTQKQLADAIDVNYSVISKYESGKVSPPSGKLARIAEVLGVSVDELIESPKHLDTAAPIARSDLKKMRNSPSDQEFLSKLYNDAIERSNGRCEICGAKAPFYTTNGQPYLEAHILYARWSDGFPAPTKIIALCPYCNCKAGFLNDEEDINNLARTLKKPE